MELLPQDLIQHEFLLRLSPVEFVNYCATTKTNAKLCRNTNFWQLKVRKTSRRELQNDWFIFFSKGGETSLLRKLFGAITLEGIILDNRAICYAALYLMEIFVPLDKAEEKQVAMQHRTAYTLIDLLSSRAETDNILIKVLKKEKIKNLRDFYKFHHEKS